MSLKTNSDHFPMQNKPSNPYNGDSVYCAVRIKFFYKTYANFMPHKTVSERRGLIADLSTRRTGFDPRSAMPYLWWTKLNWDRSPPSTSLPPVSIVPPMLHTHLHHNTTLIRRTSRRSLKQRIFNQIFVSTEQKSTYLLTYFMVQSPS